ncbi:MarC family protein [Mesorhizobium sp. M1E.F.Ca.ET.063.01.1.1]|uniref:MarC family protein n=1 Tax=Mesorhizobium sp. M1E.F.Ca.ET.063.01.1.1 TaxID=2496750 RepID=UPI000FCC4343|nr:MarC family protein [Mesorhizobium sp. M1E.F.Ca.ET.063.01.1.1]RUW86125.1 MarC family protein [Mesorhizobium sp. M1E.F.Ca.ET.063.01.1.1]
MAIGKCKGNSKPRLYSGLTVMLGIAVAGVCLMTGAPAAFAQAVPAQSSVLGEHLTTVSEVFTFLFVTLGPLNVISPFTAITDGHGVATRRRIALKAFLIATIAVLLAATVGAATLQAWGVSGAALLLAAGIILFLIALRPVLAGYDLLEPQPQASAQISASTTSESRLAFAPIAFPIIITPYGVGLLVLLFTLHPLGSGGFWILATAGFVLVLDLAAMLAAGRIAKIPFSKPALDILGCVMNVLLVALAVQVLADGIRLLAE